MQWIDLALPHGKKRSLQTSLHADMQWFLKTGCTLASPTSQEWTGNAVDEYQLKV